MLNEISSVFLFYLFIFKAQPEFEKLSDEIYYYRAGTPLRLYCYATGKPSPSIIWYRNGLKLDINGSQ
jgi:predicted cupin superfamily sugar epimerase